MILSFQKDIQAQEIYFGYDNLGRDLDLAEKYVIGKYNIYGYYNMFISLCIWIIIFIYNGN